MAQVLQILLQTSRHTRVRDGVAKCSQCSTSFSFFLHTCVFFIRWLETLQLSQLVELFSGEAWCKNATFTDNECKSATKLPYTAM